MFTNSKLTKSIRIAFAAGMVSAASSNGVFAQETDVSNTETSKVEKISVTGSRIAKAEFSSSSPMSSFDSEDVQLAGVASIDEFLKDVPAFTGYQMGTSTNNGSDQGQKKIDMRGLGFNRTLVLINGKRMIGDVNGDGAVDINSIPAALVKRVDVLKDGASTIYGSDALAGVVNFVLDDSFEGFEVGANIGKGTENGQARDDGFYLKAGVGSERGNIVMSLSYSNQEEMKQDERAFSAKTLYPILQSDGKFTLENSGSSNSRKIRVPGEGNWIVDADSGDVRGFEDGDIYDYSPVNALITPNERWQMGTIGKFDLTADTVAYFEGIYTRRTSHQRLAPDASFATTNDVETPNNGLQWNDYVPASNPYNPFGVNADNPLGLSNIGVRVNRRFVESGGRVFQQTSDIYRMLAGVKGSILDDSVFWDISYTYSEAETIDETLNYGRFDRWAIAVDPDACAADADCPDVLNPFGDYGSITPEQMSYLSTGSLKDKYSGTMDLIALNLSGDAFELPGGYAGWAIGYEHRKETGKFSPDEFLSSGLTTGGASDPQSGQFSVDEIYGEFYLPITDDFNINTSARYSDYDTSAGSSATYKIGAEYLVLDDLRLRGSYSTGFRAPNISELNQGASGGFPQVISVCEFGDRKLDAGDITQTTWDNCQTLGVDTADSGQFGFAWQSYYETMAPTEELSPEKSKSINVGFVYQPEALPGFAVNVDYWNIKIDDVIGAPDFNDLYRSCMGSDNLSSPACNAFAGTGGPHYLPDYDIYPGDAVSAFGNQGTLATSGWDFDIAYNAELNIGIISGYDLSWAATFLDSYERDYPLTGGIELAGTANGFEVFPEWRWQANAGVYGENWTFNYKIRFIAETTDRLASPSATADAIAEQTIYHDIAGSYTWNNMTFIVGINNLTDKDAPYFHSAFNANTEPGTYDVVGRRFFSSVKVSF